MRVQGATTPRRISAPKISRVKSQSPISQYGKAVVAGSFFSIIALMALKHFYLTK